MKKDNIFFNKDKLFVKILLSVLIISLILASAILVVNKIEKEKQRLNSWSTYAQYTFKPLEDVVQGSQTIPCYEISTPEQLIGALMLSGSDSAKATSLNSDKNISFVEDWEGFVTPDGNDSTYFKLSNNIDLSGKSWASKELEAGVTIDGCGYTVKNLYINTPNATDSGFCSINNGTIKNIKFENVSINGKNYVGAVAGQNNANILKVEIKIGSNKIQGKQNVGGVAGVNRGIINNVLVVGGEIYSESSSGTSYGYSGGIAGLNIGGNALIYYCHNSARINGGHYAGGIAGVTYKSITQCTNNANVTAGNGVSQSFSYAGGIVGEAHIEAGYPAIEITYCGNTGEIICINPHNTSKDYNGTIDIKDYLHFPNNASDYTCNEVTIDFGKVSGLPIGIYHTKGGSLWWSYVETYVYYLPMSQRISGNVNTCYSYTGGICGFANNLTYITFSNNYNAGNVLRPGVSRFEGNINLQVAVTMFEQGGAQPNTVNSRYKNYGIEIYENPNDQQTVTKQMGDSNNTNKNQTLYTIPLRYLTNVHNNDICGNMDSVGKNFLKDYTDTYQYLNNKNYTYNTLMSDTRFTGEKENMHRLSRYPYDINEDYIIFNTERVYVYNGERNLYLPIRHSSKVGNSSIGGTAYITLGGGSLEGFVESVNYENVAFYDMSTFYSDALVRNKYAYDLDLGEHWEIDSRGIINNGYPYLKDLYWQGQF